MEDQEEAILQPPEPSTHPKKIMVAICAMERKANSKPMKAIMNKIVEFYGSWLVFQMIPEDVILNHPVEHWPLCDCLISFYATDFPLHKAIEYERLRRPYVINDLHRQYDLLDRRKVFRALARAGIDHPRHCVLTRDEDGKVVGGELKEFNDHIEVNGMIFNKPFVEKPVSAENHNVVIYFPTQNGGGSQQLFRKETAGFWLNKVNDRSSWYSTVSTVRRDGSFIYEEFIPADGTDVKVYAVGPYYAHAEARKAPGLDGRVERDQDGKEVRYPIILSAKEKMIARRVVIAFGQTVCGFDLLRANGRSYVCDVNGFSFVKSSTKYYEDTAKILGNTILRRLASSLSIPWQVPFQADDPPLVSTSSGKIMELRCVIAVIRHGDRTPKQKIKVTVNDSRFFDLFKKYDGIQKKEIKMKRPPQLMEVLELIREMLNESLQTRDEYNKKIASVKNEKERSQLEARHEKVHERVKTWDQMRTVLEMYGHFSGINRKVQMKHLKPKESDQCSEDETTSAPLLLILKWGGELTTGHLQAEALGKLFRTLYPGIRRTDGRQCAEDTQGLGFLRLHSTYRHDLKIYSSDEGRVQMTAAAFTKGLLALEGELTPILAQMVKSGNTDKLLNNDYEARKFQNELKTYLHSILQVDRDFTAEDYKNLNPSGLRSINNAMEFIKNPRKMCREIVGYVEKMCEIIRWHRMNNPTRTLYLNESWDLAERRWVKELTEFNRSAGKSEDPNDELYDISKIPDIYDNFKYDLEHNPELGSSDEAMFERFYLCVKNMADVVVPQEYGISEESKICIAQRVCSPLLFKIRSDLHRCVQSPEDEGESLTRLDPRASEGIATPMRHVRTRLYFTSESHIHTIMNLLRYGSLCTTSEKWQRALKFISGLGEFNYLSQLVLMVYESQAECADPMERFHIELLFSPGLYPCFVIEKEKIYENRFNSNKQKIQQPLSKGKSSSIKSTGDQSDKEGTDNETAKIERHSSTRSTTLDPIIQSIKADEMKRSPTSESSFEQTEMEIKLSEKSTEGPHESDEELTDNAVNLVVLDEVAGKKYSEMARPSTIQSQITRKRYPTPELKSNFVLNAASPSSPHHRITRTMKELDKCQSTDESHLPTKPGEGNRKSATRQVHTIAKSYSDILYNKNAILPDEIPPAQIDEVESPDSGLILEANQATVGSSRGQWAKEIMLENKNDEEAKKTESTTNVETSNVNTETKSTQNAYQRTPLSAVFARDDSESKDGSVPIESISESIDQSTANPSTSSSRDEEISGTRRSRFPYRFKHHTVNLLAGGSGVDNRLISTDVLLGKFSDAARRKTSNNPAVLSTAVIARSSSAPRLQTYKAEEGIAVAEIRRFWPPLRSLETLHDTIGFKQFDQFLERMLTNSTPLPSPPKTPVLREGDTVNIHRRLKDTAKRLSMIDVSGDKSSD
ncbi:Inositol hexakisphosphate and diphosphoinositol-pentakisphosphate kinase [Aphelenchoides besseyi]|nr:Inositol hexakisphosphate and diphosphoinositol-pentakisphosphate kinase [Aphelenchoides besseyi]